MGEDQEYLARALAQSRSIYIEKSILYRYILGSTDQLTKNVKDFSVLIQIYKSLADLEGPAMPEVGQLVGVMKLRLLISVIKRGKVKVKILTLIKLLRALFHYKTFRVGNVGNGLVLIICTNLRRMRND
jgi:hypothetical protein